MKFKRVGGIPYMNWVIRLNLIQHGTTYQGLGASESLTIISFGLKASDDCVRGCAWPPEADGVISWLIP